MKKITSSSKHPRLTLSLETVRTLTSEDLSLVMGGACRKTSGGQSVTRPPGEQPPFTTC
jgi:hypothetical protein